MPSKMIVGGVKNFLNKEAESLWRSVLDRLRMHAKRHGERPVECMRQMAFHLLDGGFCHAVFVFLLTQPLNGLVRAVPVLKIGTAASPTPLERYAEVIVSEIDKCLASLGPSGACDLSEKDVAAISPVLSGVFPQGVLLHRRTPGELVPTSSLLIALFRVDQEIGAPVLRECADVLLRRWLDTVDVNLRAFADCLAAYEAATPANPVAPDSSDSHPPKSAWPVRSAFAIAHPTVRALWESAKHVIRWLPCESICRFVDDLLLGQSAEVCPTLATLVEEVCKDSHFCVGSSWQCNEGHGATHPLVDWYLWRLKSPGTDGLHFKQAVSRSLALLRDHLTNIASPQHIDEELDKVMLFHVLSSMNRGELHTPPDTTEAYAETKAVFVRFALNALLDLPHTPESIEATIRSVSQYAYQALGIDRRFHLASHLRHGARGEASLHMMREFYRDHFFHTMEVCSLGHLLCLARPHGPKPRRAFPSNTDFLRDWYVAALLHDIGYAVDVCKGLREWLGFFASGSFRTLGNEVKIALAKMGPALDAFAAKYSFAAPDKPWEDHGLVGAHHVQTLVDDLKKKHPVSITDRPIGAIAKHNCHEILIRYKDEPLSALLVLCDMLQVWCRPELPQFSYRPAWMMSVLAGSHHAGTRPEMAPAHLMSNLKFFAHGPDLIPKFKPPLVLRLEYGPAVNRDSYTFNTWLDATCNLQRVDFSALPYDIVVQIVTPAFVPPGKGVSVRQMDRLRDAASETHMEAYLSNWFPNQEYEGIPPVEEIKPKSCCCANRLCYHYESTGRKREMLSFSLKRIDGKKNLMTDTLSRFRADLSGWKHFHDDRLVLGDYSPWKHDKNS